MRSSKSGARCVNQGPSALFTKVKASNTTLTRIHGVGPLNAALILGEVGDVSRFPSRDHFASHTGTAPIAASSGDHHRHRSNRAGNRTLNHAGHVAAIVQIRCVKRRISDAVWRQLQIDLGSGCGLTEASARVKADHAAGHAPHRRPSLPTPKPPGLTERSRTVAAESG